MKRVMCARANRVRALVLKRSEWPATVNSVFNMLTTVVSVLNMITTVVSVLNVFMTVVTDLNVLTTVDGVLYMLTTVVNVRQSLVYSECSRVRKTFQMQI